MPFLPIAEREVREASRQPRTYRWRWVTATVALGLMAFVTWVTRYSPSQGHVVFVAVSTAAYIYCLLAGAVRTADTIAEEKRENTLGLLFLTDLKGWDIVFGKVLSSSVNCVFGLLAMFPMLAIPALMGGVPMDEFGKVLLNLLNTLFLSITLGFLVSSLLMHAVATISTALLLMIFAGAVLPLIAIFLREEFHAYFLAEAVMFFSPTEAHANAFGTSGGEFQQYWGPLVTNHVIAWLNLRAAIFFLPRMWQETPKNKKSERWRERIRAWRFGKGKTKARFRKRLLDQNPLYWLSNREQVSSGGVMALAVMILLGGLFLGMASGRGPARVNQMTGFWFLGVALVHVVIAFRLAAAASSRLSEDRRSGALELLLATELSVKELLRGHWMALRRQFFGPALIVLLAGLFGFVLMLQSFSETLGTAGLWNTVLEAFARVRKPGPNSDMAVMMVLQLSIQGILVLNWLAVGSLGMWMGLREKRSGFSTWTTLALVYPPPWILLIGGMVTLEEAGILRNVPGYVIVPILIFAAWAMAISHALFLWIWSRRNLVGRFQEVAANRYAGPLPFPWRAVGKFALRFAGVLTALCLALIGLRAWLNQRGEAAWKKALAAHPEFAAIYTRGPTNEPAIPTAENFAKAPVFDTILKAGSANQMTWNMSQLNGPGRNERLPWDWGEQHRLNLARVRDLYVERRLIATNETGSAAEAVLKVLEEAYAKDMQSLRREAALRPRTQFVTLKQPDRFSQVKLPPGVPPGTAMPWLRLSYDRGVLLREVVDTISVWASARIAMGEDPLEDIFIGLRIAGGFENRFQEAHHEMLLDLTQPIYDGLAARIWNNEQLKRIQEHYAGIDLWSRYEAFRKEYACQFVAAAENGGRSRRRSWIEKQMPIGLTLKVQADLLEWSVEQTPKAVDLQKRRINMAKAAEVEELNPRAGVFWGGLNPLIDSIRSLAFTQTVLDQIVVACAIERYRNDTGRLPKELNELAPKYLAVIPTDVLAEKPLGYRVKEDGKNYLLWGVGFDGTDDNGRAIYISGAWQMEQQRSGDWVWDSSAGEPPPVVKRGTRKK